ncbi:MAG: UDP-glucose/GDP-mannose dehydrogenase family protein [Desulfobacterales bacterium]|nr:UDP-glucose/GDP-mannose dehydrogenase family protein [Desulfobacterales bacterium]
MTKLSVIGLGKLGACSAACFAYRGFEVIGVDINKDLINAINSGVAPVYEPRLQELITSAKDKLKATQDYKEAIKSSDTTFFIVPTPSNEDGNFSNKYLISALRSLAAALKESNKAYHLFVITSTVSPGSIDVSLIPLIEKTSGRKLNDGFGVCYNPEFIALGSVITDFLNPDMVLIGESNEFAGEQLTKIYKTVCENNPYIARMSIISAEITKISLNSYITMKISYANTLSNICEKIPGANVDDITKALGADKRISPFYLKGGLGYGGPCFPRDNRAFAVFAAKYGVDAKLAKATDEVNGFQVKHLVDLALDHISATNNGMVSVLGLAYKPNTPVIEESPGIKLVGELLKRNLKVLVYDELASDNAKVIFGDRIIYSTSAKECLSKSSVCIVTTMTDEFKEIDGSYIANDPTVVIDCWRILEPSRLGAKVKYIAVGRFDYEPCTACA